MKYTKIPTNTFKELVLNAGIVLTDFNPTTGTVNDSDFLGATTGGLTVNVVPSFIDFAEDIDNAPKNTKEFMRLDDYDINASGSFVSVNDESLKKLNALADYSEGKITLRKDVDIDNDFFELWIVADYSDDNSEETGGFIAVHLMNVLNTGGFQMTTSDKEKGNFPFEFTAHYSIDEQEAVPVEIYIKASESETDTEEEETDTEG